MSDNPLSLTQEIINDIRNVIFSPFLKRYNNDCVVKIRTSCRKMVSFSKRPVKKMIHEQLCMEKYEFVLAVINIKTLISSIPILEKFSNFRIWKSAKKANMVIICQ